jgi:hypothetical protein
MSKRRLIYYSDARHYHFYCYDPPMRIEDARIPVEEVAGTGVDTFVYGFGLGPNVFHLTEVGEIIGARHDVFRDSGPRMPALPFWRTHNNVMSLKERGLDINDVLADRAHEKGMEFFGSFRLTHSNPPEATDAYDTWQFRIDHPEWCIKGEGKHCFNWVYPEVRAERFAIIEEAVNKYDLDGFEIDLTFAPYYFEKDEIAANRPILTEFLRDVRKVVEAKGKERGRPMALGARVLPSMSANLDRGFDLSVWLEEGLLDFVVPMVYGAWLQTNADYPFEWLLEPASKSGCAVYPALQSRLEAEMESTRPAYWASIDHYRAAAAAYWQKGGDGLYLPWFEWPVGPEQRQVLCEIHDPELIKEKPKRYVVVRQCEECEEFGYGAPLPLTLELGQQPPGQLTPVYIADDSERAEATLRLRIANTTSHDSIGVTLNGVELSWDTCRKTSYEWEYYWFDFPLPRGVLKSGRNEVGVALQSRPPKLGGEVVLESIEVVVDYPATQAALRAG